MHRCWSRDPYIYKRNSNSKPRSKGRKLDIIIKKLISKPLKDETQVNTEIKRKKIITDESTTVEKLTNEIDVKLEKNILEIKELIRDKLVSGKGLDIEVKKKVLDFYKQIGDIRKSSILLGISERMITNWNSEQIHRDQNTIEIE